MRNEVFSNISKIIQRDSKVTTYKFALLRGVIDMIQDNSPYITFSNGRVHFPLGLLVEKWMLYYYPILESVEYIPQSHGEGNLAFAATFKTIIAQYTIRGGFSAFYNDLKNKGIPHDLQADFKSLAKKIEFTITRMPMKYIGRSISNDFYSIFHYETAPKNKPSRGVDAAYLIHHFGTFSIPHDYYEAFQLLGSFINGQDSILLKWAEFSVNASGQTLSIEKVVGEVLKNPITEREVAESKQIFKSILKTQGHVFCVWTGKLLTNYDVDHLIPFSVWKNNDLWNLLPSQATTNHDKRDKIPSIELIERRKDSILHYWELLYQHQPQRFQKEIQVSLLGNHSFANWQATAFGHLQNSCNYLIVQRGFSEWNI